MLLLLALLTLSKVQVKRKQRGRLIVALERSKRRQLTTKYGRYAFVTSAISAVFCFVFNSTSANAAQVVVFMPEGDKTRMVGTMRLGSRVTILRPGSRAFSLYGGEGKDELEVRTKHEAATSPSV